MNSKTLRNRTGDVGDISLNFAGSMAIVEWLAEMSKLDPPVALMGVVAGALTCGVKLLRQEVQELLEVNPQRRTRDAHGNPIN